MARQIDLDQLMKYPLRRGSEHCDEKNADPRFLNGVESILEWAQTMPTLTPPNEWVSVEERLPGVSGNYICAVKDKNGSVWTIPAEWSLEMKMWIGAFGEIKNIVTHWMPLPEPPDRRPPEGEEDA